MSFQHVHQSRSQSPQTVGSTSQFAPRPFSVQQSIEPAKSQPNLLGVLLHNSQSVQTTEPTATTSPNVIQAKGDTKGSSQEFLAEQDSNRTGLPDNLKAEIKNLSGYSLDDVRVHYNSSPEPPQLSALAYAQGTDIHVSSGQEEQGVSSV